MQLTKLFLDEDFAELAVSLLVVTSLRDGTTPGVIVDAFHLDVDPHLDVDGNVDDDSTVDLAP